MMRIVMIVAAAMALAGTGQAQTASRTPWGDPDLQGLWSNASVTPLERPAALADKSFWTETEVADVEKNGLQQVLRAVAPEVPVSGELNSTWLEIGKVVRSRHTSLVVDPADGKIPYTPDGKKRWDALPVNGKRLAADAPEDRSLVERCLLIDPVLLPNPFYNNNHQIVQIPGYIVISSEMMHQSRIIPLDGRPRLRGDVTQWLGDSRGHWEGQTLVIETTNFSARSLYRGATTALRIVERLTRIDAATIDYQVTVTDPATFTQPWTAIATLRATAGPIYEYAYHEGNYGLAGILKGARSEETR